MQPISLPRIRIDAAYRDEKWWAKTAILNTAASGKFSSDRTIEDVPPKLRAAVEALLAEDAV